MIVKFVSAIVMASGLAFAQDEVVTPPAAGNVKGREQAVAIRQKEQQIITNQGKVQRIRDSISDCKESKGGVIFWCGKKPNRSQYSDKEIDALKREIKDIEEDTDTLAKALDNLKGQKQTRDDRVAAGAADQFANDINRLLQSKDKLKNDLALAKIDIGQVMLKMDQTLLGEYSKYVAKKAIEDFTKSGDMCKAIEQCKSMKDVKAAVGALKTNATKNFDAFKKEIRAEISSLKAKSESTDPMTDTIDRSK